MQLYHKARGLEGRRGQHTGPGCSRKPQFHKMPDSNLLTRRVGTDGHSGAHFKLSAALTAGCLAKTNSSPHSRSNQKIKNAFAQVSERGRTPATSPSIGCLLVRSVSRTPNLTSPFLPPASATASRERDGPRISEAKRCVSVAGGCDRDPGAVPQCTCRRRYTHPGGAPLGARPHTCVMLQASGRPRAR